MTGNRHWVGIVAAIVLFGLIGITFWRVEGLERAMQSLSDGRAADSREKLDMEFGRTCAAQAEHVFTSEGFSLEGHPVVNGTLSTMANYTNHYNKRLGKCFMLLTTTSFDPTNHSIAQVFNVTDAFEGATYAEYSDDQIGTSQAPHLFKCNQKLPNQPQVQCRALDEWKKLIEPLMETGNTSL